MTFVQVFFMPSYTRRSFSRFLFRLVPVRKKKQQENREASRDNQKVERLTSDQIRAASNSQAKEKPKTEYERVLSKRLYSIVERDLRS